MGFSMKHPLPTPPKSNKKQTNKKQQQKNKQTKTLVHSLQKETQTFK